MANAASPGDRRRRIDALCSEALELPATQRDAYLAARTAADPELRAAVEELLAAVAEGSPTCSRQARGRPRSQPDSMAMAAATAFHSRSSLATGPSYATITPSLE